MKMTDYPPRMTLHATKLGLLRSGFTLVDVGASQGIDPVWFAFGSGFRAYGFEPLVEECDRLNRSRPHPGVEYFPYFVGARGQRPPTQEYFRTGRDKQFIPDYYMRSSARRGEELLKQESIERIAGMLNPRFTTECISLDEFAETHKVANADFIKIDTDGSDMEVLLGAERLMKEKNVLGFALEALFNRTPPANGSLLSEIDAVAKRLGYSLFDLSPWRYSRRSLPAPFKLQFPANTTRGPVGWADVLYLRDYCGPAGCPTGIADEKLMKLACLYELFQLPDCAAELMEAFRDRIESATSGRVGELLDCLTPEVDGKRLSFAAYNREFDTNLSRFYGGLSPEVEAILNSTSWRMTGLFRWAARLLHDSIALVGKRRGA